MGLVIFCFVVNFLAFAQNGQKNWGKGIFSHKFPFLKKNKIVTYKKENINKKNHENIVTIACNMKGCLRFFFTFIF
jgi:hypothetical protein